MLSLSNAARKHITEMLSQESPKAVVRISSSPDGIRFATDRVRIGDATFDDGGKCILAIDQMALRTISGQSLDVEIDDGKPRLVLYGK
jgi:Fe-S cluster assembly iron-binding protein IscA